MNDHDLRRLLDDATSDLHAAPDPPGIWAAGLRRRRRTALAAATSSVAAAVVIGTLPATLLSGDGGDTPEPAPGSTSQEVTATHSATTDAPIPYLTEAQVADQLDPAEIAQLPWHPAADLDSWDPVDAVPLADDPVRRAVLAVQSRYDEAPAISVLGDDGRWRSVDVSGLEVDESSEYHVGFGITRGSFSPGGTTLAIGQRDAVVLVDVTTGQRTVLDIPDLGETSWGRATWWAADGATVYLGREFAPDRRGFAVDVRSGEASRVPFDPSRAAFLGEAVIEHEGGMTDGSMTIRVFAAGASADLRSDVTISPIQTGYVDQMVGFGSRWAGRREETGWTDADPRKPNAPASGVLVSDDRGHPVRLLPVRGWTLKGGGGQVLGWLDANTVAFAMLESDRPGGMHALAWDVTTDEVTRLADYTWSGGLVLAPPG